MKTKLPRFEGREVQAATMSLTGRCRERIGALALDEEVYLIVRATVTKVAHHDGSGDQDGLFVRNHTVRAGAIMLLANGDGPRLLDEAAMLADERFGIQTLFRDGGNGDNAKE
jgi:hypothetical protein